jgi:hypothetical protein
MEQDERMRALYDAFNARDVETVLEAMAPDVDWPNGMEGTRERGHDAVRAYWLRQWKSIAPSVEPETITRRDDGATVVRVHQVVRDLAGNVLNDRVVAHAYWFEDGLVTRMEIEEPA